MLIKTNKLVLILILIPFNILELEQMVELMLRKNYKNLYD